MGDVSELDAIKAKWASRTAATMAHFIWTESEVRTLLEALEHAERALKVTEAEAVVLNDMVNAAETITHRAEHRANQAESERDTLRTRLAEAEQQLQVVLTNGTRAMEMLCEAEQRRDEWKQWSDAKGATLQAAIGAAMERAEAAEQRGRALSEHIDELCVQHEMGCGCQPGEMCEYFGIRTIRELRALSAGTTEK